MTTSEVCAEAQMKIRKPAPAVFDALINPAITTKFWFTKSSGPLVAGAVAKWDWEMYEVSANISVLEIKQNEKIVFAWGQERIVEFSLQRLPGNATYVVVRETGYSETGTELLEAVKNSTGGFITVLDGMKAYLEHGIALNLIQDKFPRELAANR